MKPETARELLAALDCAKAQLKALSASTESVVDAMTRSFKTLAAQANRNLTLAAGVVTCVESESVESVLSKVESLCATIKDLLGRRFDAVTRVLETLKAVGPLLAQLAWVTRRQQAIALQFQALSVLTKVEVAQLGSEGADFHHLAQELADFAANVSTETQELARLMEDRRRSIEETRQVFSAGLPGLRKEMSRIESDVGGALQAISARLAQLSTMPGQFRACVQQTARQIDGVVAAIQSHDITRQQIEHVEGALEMIASSLSLRMNSQGPLADELSEAYAGLTIQTCQLRNIKETVTSWTSQIRICVGDIERLSASEIAAIGPVVLQQEHDLSSQLAGIEQLQQSSEAHSEKVRFTLAGLSSLLELVNDHTQRSERIRDSLQILTLNSIVEARRIGVRGSVVSAIAGLINTSSEEWNTATGQSRVAQSQILDLVRETDELMTTFSDASCRKLHEDQRQTQATLADVRATAAFVAKEAAQMHITTQEMQHTAQNVHHAEELLLAGFSGLDPALATIESVTSRLISDDPQIEGRRDAAELERRFSVLYTTEMERNVLRAALHGTALPLPQQALAGNGVELF